MDQISLFDVTSAWGMTYTLLSLDDWMKELVSDGEWCIDMDGHPAVLRAVQEVPDGQKYYHFRGGEKLYGAIFVG